MPGRKGELRSVADAGKHVSAGIEGIGLSIANMVIVGFLVSVRCAGIGHSVDLQGGSREASHDPRLSIDNLGCHSHTGGKE